MAIPTHFAYLIIANFVCTAIQAFDPMPMQDFCVADLTNPYAASASGSGVFPCKPVKSVSANDFHHSGLHLRKSTNNPLKIGLTRVGVTEVPGFNTMGFNMARLDLEPNGAFPLHLHQKASELHIVLEGCLGVGFISSESSNYTLYHKKLVVGDMYIVPMGLVHYQINCGTGNTSSYAIFNSQNQGLNSVARAVFGAHPNMDSTYLSSAYQLDVKTIKNLQTKTWA